MLSRTLWITGTLMAGLGIGVLLTYAPRSRLGQALWWLLAPWLGGEEECWSATPP